MNSVTAWKVLRSPFALTPLSVNFHKCEWERIDVDKSGCLLCSQIHVCSVNTCKNIVQTTDSTVCEITGFCVRNSNVMTTGYSEEVISYGSSGVYTGDTKKQEIYDDIDIYVHELLLSKQAVEVCQVERKNYTTKIYNHILRSATAGKVDAIDMIQAALQYTQEKKLYKSFNLIERKSIAVLCCQQLRSTIPICNMYLKMHIKRCDMRAVVFGLMFLMRSGICIFDICVLPSIVQLLQCLPNESNLLKYFDFKSKNITDIENRFKFHLRHVSRAQMHKMGFHLSR